MHHHSGLAGFTPELAFTGRCNEVAKTKQLALDTRFRENPERFSHGRPRVKMPPEFVAINPLGNEDGGVVSENVNFPTLTAAGYIGSK